MSMRGVLLRHGIQLAVLALPFSVCAQNPTGRLDFSDSVRMVDCDPVTTVPCFRLKFNVVDSQGAPLAVQLPAPDKLADSITVRVDQQDITPFYAVARADARAVRGRLAVVLVDISGSMNRVLPTGETRFAAAKIALSQFLEGFENGTDRVAIVPFESHHVEPTIRAARFASTKQEALQQVQALPTPLPRNNTGLYSAVTIGLDVLSSQMKNAASKVGAPEALLIIMTDGTNEVLRGDDPGLLAGPAGLDEAAGKVLASGIQAIGVGFGDPKEIDETALRKLSTKYYMAEDSASLKRIFSFARTLLSNRIQATFTSPSSDRASLAGKTLHVSVRLKFPSGQELASDPKTWATPQMSTPVPEGKCEAEEKAALLQKSAPAGGGWMSVLRPILVFLGLGVLLLILWAWVPRLVWADQYIGITPTTARWTGQTTTSHKPGRPAPPGFGSGKSSYKPQRAPGDATVVQPRPDFTKTRLDNRQGGYRSND
jgi:Mg-chelatase subunit ChlD